MKNPDKGTVVGYGGITDANYLYMTLVGDRTKGEAPSLKQGKEYGTFILHENPADGKRIVLGCPSFPKLSNAEMFADDFDGMETHEIMAEMYLNGMGRKLDFADNAYIRVLDSEGKPDPVVFMDLADALAYLGEN